MNSRSKTGDAEGTGRADRPCPMQPGRVHTGDFRRYREMRRSVHRKIEEESGMKKWNMKRVFVVAAAICVLGTITAVAAGKVAYTSGGGSHLDDFTYDKLGEMETKLGYTTNAPKYSATDTGLTWECPPIRTPWTRMEM